MRRCARRPECLDLRAIRLRAQTGRISWPSARRVASDRPRQCVEIGDDEVMRRAACRIPGVHVAQRRRRLADIERRVKQDPKPCCASAGSSNDISAIVRLRRSSRSCVDFAAANHRVEQRGVAGARRRHKDDVDESGVDRLAVGDPRQREPARLRRKFTGRPARRSAATRAARAGRRRSRRLRRETERPRTRPEDLAHERGEPRPRSPR